MKDFSLGLYILDEHGEPKPVSDLRVWARWMENNPRHVGSDVVGDAHVSTVFLTVDHNWRGEGPPVLFETMVFGGPLSGECRRYETAEQAIDGHAAMCLRVRDSVKAGG